MRESSGAVAKIDEGHVRGPGNDACSHYRRDLLGIRTKPVAKDGEVVRCEVPKYGYIALVEAEIHAARGNEVDVPKLP